MKPFCYLGYLLFNWAIIFCSLFLVKIHIAFFPVSFLLVANRQFANYLVGHDGVHSLIFKNKFWNDLVSRLFCLAPVFVSLQSYREKHLLHHELLGTFVDPDKRLYDFYPVSKGDFFIKLMKHFFTLRMTRDFLVYFTPWFDMTRRNFYRREKIQDLIQTTVVALGFSWIFISVFGAWIFLGLWVLPLLLLMPYYYFVSALQHGGVYEREEHESSRNIHGPLYLMEFLLPCATNYHGAHHLYPQVPFFYLKRVCIQKKLVSVSYKEALKILIL